MKKRKFIETYIVEEVAKALKLHPYTIRRLCREGKIPAVKVEFGRNSTKESSYFYPEYYYPRLCK